MKSLFNFYLDDDVKVKTIKKLNKVCGEESKGQLASFIRVQLNNFLNTPDDEIDLKLIQAIKDEYQYTTKKNKRSRL